MFNDNHLPQSEGNGAHAEPPAEGPRDASAYAPRVSRLALCVTAASALALGVVGTVAYGVWFNHDQQAYVEAIANARQSLGMRAGVSGLPASQVVSAEAATSTVPGSASTTDSERASSNSDPTHQVEQQEEGNKQAVWSGQVAPAWATANPPAGLAVARLAAPGATSASPATSGAPASNAASLHSSRHATGSSDSTAPQSAASRSVKDTRAQQERRIAAANARQSARQNARHPPNLFARMGQFFRRVSYRQHGGGNQQQQDLYSHP